MIDNLVGRVGNRFGDPVRHDSLGFFFFQAEDGIRDLTVTGVQTCALPICHVFADGAYAGEKLETALAGRGQWTLEIVKRSDQAKGFQLLPRRWVVERTFGWFGRNRRLARDFERTITSREAWLFLASVQLLAR